MQIGKRVYLIQYVLCLIQVVYNQRRNRGSLQDTASFGRYARDAQRSVCGMFVKNTF